MNVGPYFKNVFLGFQFTTWFVFLRIRFSILFHPFSILRIIFALNTHGSSLKHTLELPGLSKIDFFLKMGLAAASRGLGKQFYEEHYDYIIIIRGFFPDEEPATESDYLHIKEVFRTCGRYWHCYRPFINFNNVPYHSSKSIEIVMDVGDLVEDEVFVIVLIRKISCEYPKSVWKFSTAYGCVLSSHLFDYMPKWLCKVVDADNRVFLQNGQLCFYKQKMRSAVELKNITKIQLAPASGPLQAIFMMGLTEDKYQQKIHKAKVCVPKKALKYLNLRENLSLSIKAAHCEAALELDDTSKFKSIKPENFVETTLEFTRQQFSYLLDLDLSIPNNYPKTANTCELLGCKLTVGLEALLEIDRVILDQDLSGSVCEKPEEKFNWIKDQLISMLTEEEPERRFHAATKQLFKDREYREEEKDGDDYISETESEEYESDSEYYYYDNYDFSDEYETISGEDEEDDREEFLEREILETLKHDPDLLMRIIELNAEQGHDSSTLVELLKNLELVPTTSRQKGVADIDPQKLAKARQPRELPEYSDEEEESDLLNDEDEADLPYCESVEEAKKQKRIVEHDD